MVLGGFRSFHACFSNYAHLMQIVRVDAWPLFSLFRVNRIFEGVIWLANLPHVIEITFLL